jgi:hypothetical protein
MRAVWDARGSSNKRKIYRILVHYARIHKCSIMLSIIPVVGRRLLLLVAKLTRTLTRFGSPHLEDPSSRRPGLHEINPKHRLVRHADDE